MEQKLLNHTISKTLHQKIAAVNYYAYGQAGGLTLTSWFFAPKRRFISYCILHDRSCFVTVNLIQRLRWSFSGFPAVVNSSFCRLMSMEASIYMEVAMQREHDSSLARTIRWIFHEKIVNSCCPRLPNPQFHTCCDQEIRRVCTFGASETIMWN
jgi:hypothetical protein